jgi:hypothetical protein
MHTSVAGNINKHEKTFFKMFFFLILDASILEKEQLKQLRAHMRLYSTCKNRI